MRQGADTYRSVEYRAGLRLRAQFAAGLPEIGVTDELRRTLDEALALADEARESAGVPELQRVRARMMHRQDPGDPAAATVLRQAVALARDQGAWLHALRAATELVRLERRSGGPAAGEASLQEIYGLMCIGLGLIFGIMRIVNFAQGEILMLGMFVSFFSRWSRSNSCCLRSFGQ